MFLLLVVSGLLIFSVISSRVLYRFGVPVLVVFLGLGVLMGSEGLGGIIFQDTQMAQTISCVCLAFITFSGGFGTNWKKAKKSVPTAIGLATVGVVLTAVIVALAVTWIIPGFNFVEGLLVGSIIASTDATPVFAILRSKKLNLKPPLGSLLEIESGSNDPIAYLMMVACIAIIQGDFSSLWYVALMQVAASVAIGFIMSFVSSWLINKIRLEIDGLYSLLVLGLILLAFSFSDLLSANAYLAIYIIGLYLGNTKLIHKASLVRYFDGFSWLMQIILFFTLGLLVVPSQLFDVTFYGLIISLIIIFVARPIAVFVIMTFFKRPFKEQLFVSWVGFRGSSSIVFATFPLVLGLSQSNLIFNIVFFASILTLALQGTFVSYIAKKLDLVSKEENIMLTFTDYSGDYLTDLMEVKIAKYSKMDEKTIMDLNLPPQILFVMVKRDSQVIIPRGETRLLAGDTLLLAGDNDEQLEKVKKMAIEELDKPISILNP